MRDNVTSAEAAASEISRLDAARRQSHEAQGGGGGAAAGYGRAGAS